MGPGHGKAGAKTCKFHNLGQTADYSFDADNLDLNYNADDYTRTIVVEDTLKPVIKLQYGDKFIKRSAADKLGRKAANDDARTAGLKIQKADENYPTPDDENTDTHTRTCGRPRHSCPRSRRSPSTGGCWAPSRRRCPALLCSATACASSRSRSPPLCPFKCPAVNLLNVCAKHFVQNKL